jgi:dTDP-4-dehydrorhamnose 3,5-epimerase
MEIKETKLTGVYIIEPNVFSDERGRFVKVFHKDTLQNQGLHFNPQESFYTVSKKDVIRGMHFQIPPKAYAKVVYCLHGSIIDVVLDLREGSPTYGESVSVELSDKNHRAIYIPEGYAHGFRALEDNSTTVYLQETTHSPEHDLGIHMSSFGMDWSIENPIMSERDKSLPHLKDFKTPFKYKK